MRFAICNFLLLIAVVGCEERKSAVVSPVRVVSAGVASVHGKVSFGGTITPPAVIDKAGLCPHGEAIADETVLVSADRGLANVLVYVEGVSSAAPPPVGPVVMDQKDCRFVPHVVAVRAGQVLRMKNSDGEMHNVHGLSAENPQFNLGLPLAGSSADRTFAKTEIFAVKCDVHPWMKAYVGVFASDYVAVTHADGSFEIKGLPPGSYELTAWHERFGELKQTIEVKQGAAEANFSFGPPK